MTPRLERRLDTDLRRTGVSRLLGAVTGLVVAALLLVLTGRNPVTVLTDSLGAVFGSKRRHRGRRRAIGADPDVRTRRRALAADEGVEHRLRRTVPRRRVSWHAVSASTSRRPAGCSS
ncbi:MAG: hypothetical protein R2713_19845 [Ilumatobacteraceae bacterium]